MRARQRPRRGTTREYGECGAVGRAACVAQRRDHSQYEEGLLHVSAEHLVIGSAVCPGLMRHAAASWRRAVVVACLRGVGIGAAMSLRSLEQRR